MTYSQEKQPNNNHEDSKEVLLRDYNEQCQMLVENGEWIENNMDKIIHVVESEAQKPVDQRTRSQKLLPHVQRLTLAISVAGLGYVINPNAPRNETRDLLESLKPTIENLKPTLEVLLATTKSFIITIKDKTKEFISTSTGRSFSRSEEGNNLDIDLA